MLSEDVLKPLTKNFQPAENVTYLENKNSRETPSICTACREKFYKIIAEFSDDWVYWINPDSSINYVSPSCKLITGYDADDMIADKNFLKRIVYPEDIGKLEKHEKLIAEGVPLCMDEYRIISKTGEIKWISCVCQAVYDDDDNYIGRHVCNKDITTVKNQKENSEQNDKLILQIYDNASIGYYQIYFDGNLKSVNNIFLKMLGYSSANFFDKINFEEYCVLSLDKRESFKKSLKKYGKLKDFESEWVMKDGTLVYLRETARAVRDANGLLEYYEGIVQDITEKKKAEAAFLEASRQKRKSEELKTEFLATISHEIRTPLNVILNFVRLMKMDIDETMGKDVCESINIIEREGNRIQRTIDLILEMSQLQTGTYDYNIERIDLIEDVLNDIYENYRAAAEENNLLFALTNKLSDAGMVADKHSISQIFSQLIDNAVKYTKCGKVETVLYRNRNNEITVEVTDTGIGIHEEYLPLLYKVFSQEDNTYSRTYEGMGLGLAIAKKHCELNNATISVESKKGKGTTFTVIFRN